MQATAHPPAVPHARTVRPAATPRRSLAAISAAMEGPNLEELSLDNLRRAIRSNHVSFPSPTPVFAKHDRPDLQWKFAQLYFVSGWNCRDIAAKYGLIRQRVQQVLNTWKRRAVQMGYLQYIPSAEAVDLLWAEAARTAGAHEPTAAAQPRSIDYAVLVPASHDAPRDLSTRG